jgi:hypothetical protein
MDNSSFFSFVLGIDAIMVSADFTMQDLIFSSAQCIVILLVDFLQETVIVSVPENVNFFKSGSKVN